MFVAVMSGLKVGGFIAAYLGLFLLHAASGWRSLSKQYSSNESIPCRGALFRLALVYVGPTDWMSMLTTGTRVCVDQDGLRLSVPFWSRAFHPPLYIPWSAVPECTKCRSGDECLITVSGVPIRFTGRLATAVLDQHARAQSSPPTQATR